MEILHLGVEQIARDDQKIDPLLQTEIHDTIERLPRGDPQSLGRCAGVRLQSSQGTVEMNVGGMNETHRATACGQFGSS